MGIIISWLIKISFYRNITPDTDSDARILLSSVVRITILIILYCLAQKANKILLNNYKGSIENMTYLLIFGSLVQLTNLPKNVLYLSDKYMPLDKMKHSIILK